MLQRGGVWLLASSLAWAGACGRGKEEGVGHSARAPCPVSPAAGLPPRSWQGHDAQVGAGVWAHAEVVRDSGGSGAHGYLALLRLPDAAGVPSGGGSRLPGGAPRVSAHWYGNVADTLRYDADRRVLRVGTWRIAVDSANVVLVDVAPGGRVRAVRTAGCVALTPEGTAADRALASLPAARAFAER